MLNRQDVVLAYRYILNRDPESEAVIAEKLATYRDLPTLRAAMIACDEFQADGGGQSGGAFIDTVSKGYWDPPHRIDYRVPAEIEARLTERIRAQWTKLGEEEPYWSVLTHEAFRARNLSSANLAAFRDTGRGAVELIDLAFGKADLPLPRGECLEVGCGVGRITRHLAARFDRVVAIDISAGNLDLCRHYLEEEAVGNVDTRLIAALDDFAALPGADFLYSMIVFQHNSPPLQYRMLEMLLAKIRAGGSCLFQTVADLPGYGFDAEAYLASPPPEMEIHSLPMAAILELMQRNGFVVDAVRMDPWVNAYGSYTFLGHRPG